MKNNKILKCILKYLPLYGLVLLAILSHRYITSLTGLFIGEVLGSFNQDPSILPGFLSQFINHDDLEITNNSYYYNN